MLKNNSAQSPIKFFEVLCNGKRCVLSCVMLLCTHLLNRMIILLIYMKPLWNTTWKFQYYLLHTPHSPVHRHS